jgi:hypothetical protein
MKHAEGRLLIGPQVTNLPHTAAEPQPKPEVGREPVQRRLAIGAQLAKLPHRGREEIKV